MPLYSYADVTLATNFSVAGLLAVIHENKSSDITFQIMNSPPVEPAGIDWVHHWHTPSGDISLSLARREKGFLLRFPALADFVIAENGSRISAWPAPGTDEETVRHLLLDQVMPRVLSHWGRLVLHASAVCVDDRVIAFAGDTGSGKSTLAAGLHISGRPLLTDDGLVLRSGKSGIEAIPCYAGLRLLPESVAALFTESPRKKAMASYSLKNRVTLPQNEEIDPVELAALFVLDKSGRENKEPDVSIASLSQRDACMELVRNSFQLDVSNQEQVTALFSSAAAVAERVPVFSLSYPRDFSIMPSVFEAVLLQIKKT